MYEQPAISEERLQACLQAQYGLRCPITLEFLPLGQDSRAGVYRVVSEDETPYLLKVKQGVLYEPGCFVPRYLCDQGVTFVVAPLPIQDHALWTSIEDWTVTMYPFIEGNSGLTGMTDEHWKGAGAVFKQIHQVTPPVSGFESVRKETFDPTEYARWIRDFEAQHLYVEGGSIAERSLRDSWRAHQSTIHMVVTSLEKLADILQERPLPSVICHADFHQNNLLRDQTGQVFVIDWDDVMLAPKERDFIFVNETPIDAQTPSPFFQGYGQTEIDWTALTYYRYERIVQDVIAYADEACFRDDLGEETKASCVQYFHKNLTEGMIDAVYATSAHLPPDFHKDNRQV